MNLYIKINNGQPINHPATEENLLQALGAIDNTWEVFVRTQMPVLGIYEIFDTNLPIYQKIDGVWTDFWHVREMTDEEKQAKQKSVKDDWNSFPRPNQTTWVFDEETCSYKAPIPKPEDGNNWYWQGSTNSWQITPDMPEDGQIYRFNVFVGQWQVAPAYPQDGKQYKFSQQQWSWVEINV